MARQHKDRLRTGAQAKGLQCPIKLDASIQSQWTGSMRFQPSAKGCSGKIEGQRYFQFDAGASWWVKLGICRTLAYLPLKMVFGLIFFSFQITLCVRCAMHTHYWTLCSYRTHETIYLFIRSIEQLALEVK